MAFAPLSEDTELSGLVIGMIDACCFKCSHMNVREQVLRVGLMGDKFGFSPRIFQQLQLFCSEMGPILTMMNEQHAAQNQIRQWQLLSNMFAQRGSNLTTLKNVAGLS